jgi:hypothetical protein
VLFCFLLLLWLLGFLIGLLFVLLLLGQIAKNILAAKVNEARKLDGEKKRIVKATADALTTANQQLFRISSSLSSIPCSFCAVRKVSCAILFSVVAVASWVFNWVKEKIETEKSLKKLQNTQRSNKPAKKATKEDELRRFVVLVLSYLVLVRLLF